MDGFEQFQNAQKEGWKHFAPLEAVTTVAAARLVRHAGLSRGMRVLDVGCGTGVVAITAARLGAQVRAVDLTPELLVRARENAAIAGVEVDFSEADVEQLPFTDGEFDAVVSQFAHIFAPRPDVAVREMLRVLRPGGTIAFSTWPPELLVGRASALAARYMPAPPPGMTSPVAWGDPSIVRERLGDAVKDLVFDRDSVEAPALSPQHYRARIESSAGQVVRMVETLSQTNPEALREYRTEFDSIVTEYLRENRVSQGYLLTRARKI